MNEDADQSRPEPQQPQQPAIEAPAPRIPKRSFGYWARRLLACNPFYLVSAALLLYGCYRVSTDPGVLRENSLHLFFNFGSIQFYELLLVITAIFLAHRRIWYDSTLLVGLENLLLIVPFILISQGALVGQQLTEKHLTMELCVVAGILAALRISGLKRLIGKLNFPPQAVWLAAAVVAVNVILPALYRGLHENKVGTQVESGAAYYTNEFAWMLLLPALCALALLLPAAIQKGALWPERAWLPGGMFALWLIGTAVHLYCLGYIYDFNLRRELLAPALWVIFWIIQRRAADLKLSLLRESVLLIPPLLATFMAISSGGNKVFLTISVLNATIYAIICFARSNQVALHLLVISVAMLVGGFPEDWGRKLFSGFNRPECVWGAVAAYGLFWAMRWRNPVCGVFGGLIAGLVGGIGLGDRASAAHWAIQSGLVVLLMHSLRWEDRYHSGAKWLRVLACGIWVAHAFLWMHTGGAVWMVCCVTTPLLLAYALGKLTTQQWGPVILPLAAALVILTAPADATAIKVSTFSTGVLAVIGSFLLFAIGTIAAVTRHRWHKQ